MKNRLFTLATMVLVTLLVVSLCEAQQATFRMVEPGSPPYAIGENFFVELRVDALAAHPGDALRTMMLSVEFTGGNVGLADEADPFSDILTGFTPVRNEWDGGNQILLSMVRPSPGLPVADDILVARVEFIQTGVGSTHLEYLTGTPPADGTRYSLQSAVTTPIIPDEFHRIPLDVGLSVEMSVFTASVADKGVIVKWRTESELNNLGFDVYRSESLDGTFTKVNQTRIAGAGTDGTPHSYLFTDENVEVGKTYYYYIEDISYSGVKNRSHIIRVTVDVTGKLKVVGLMPSKFALLQNFPNPFNPETWIPYQLPQDTSVTVRIYNFNGQPIRTIALGQQAAGTYLTKDRAVYWDGRDHIGEKVASGVYFYTLQADDFKATKRMVIVE
jgi:hypothetical protein